MKNLTVFGKEIIDEKCITQIENCFSENDIAVLTADAHYGYAHPIGGAIAYKNKVSVSGVGFDIACGNKAVRTDVKANDIDVPKVMDEIFKRISFGVGRHNDEKIDHEVFDKIDKAEFYPQRKLFQSAKAQLGTVGSGNHYVDLFKDKDGFLWIGVHFGSSCQIEWITEIVTSFKTCGSAVFVKQLGTYLSKELKMSDRHGGNIADFPKHLQIREFPL